MIVVTTAAPTRSATDAILEALHAQMVVSFAFLRIRQNFIGGLDLLELFLRQFAWVLVGMELCKGSKLILLFTINFKENLQSP